MRPWGGSLRPLVFSALIAAGAALSFPPLVGAVPIVGQGTWESTLLPRDVDADGRVDAYYDTDLGITWIAEIVVSPAPWQFAMQYSGAFSITGMGGTISGWRLPATSLLGTNGCTTVSLSWADCASTSEMAHLNCVTLGNKGYGTGGELNNTGPFVGINSDTVNQSYYWSATETTPNSGDAWAFYLRQGVQVNLRKGMPLSYFLVHDGDIGRAVPEPGTVALLGLGLLGLVVTRRLSWPPSRARARPPRWPERRIRSNPLSPS